DEDEPLRLEPRQELQAAVRTADREMAHLARRRRVDTPAGRTELVIRPERAVEEQDIGSADDPPHGVINRSGRRDVGERSPGALVREPQADIERLGRRRAGVAGGAREPEGGQRGRWAASWVRRSGEALRRTQCSSSALTATDD